MMGFGAGGGVGTGVGGGCGAGEGDGAGAGEGAGDGFGAGVGVGALSWRSTRLSDPTVSVTVRSGPEFGAAISASVAAPCPDAGDTVAHVASAAAVQRHPSWVRMSIGICPPAAASGVFAADTSNWHGAPA
jgi:hypothetical protein